MFAVSRLRLKRNLRSADPVDRSVATQFPDYQVNTVVVLGGGLDNSTYLAVPPPTAGYAPVFSHNDLGIEHVLVDPVAWRATGIIDWSDADLVAGRYW